MVPGIFAMDCDALQMYVSDPCYGMAHSLSIALVC